MHVCILYPCKGNYMFIEFFETRSQDRLGRTWTLRHGRFRCDQCGSTYESTNNLHRDLKRPRNYCSKQCSDNAKKPGGLSHAAFRATNLKRYGVNAPAQNVQIAEKMKQTNHKRYGSTSSMGSIEVQTRAIETRLEKYGVKFSAQIPGVMDKVAVTNLQRYGTINPMNAPEIIATYDYDAMYEKRLATMKCNGTIGRRISNSERQFYQLLLERFTPDDIEIQIKVPDRRWCIDFFIRSEVLWIQLDGVYWHGLDRPIDFIKTSEGKQDRAIYRKWCDDRKQERWFQERNMKLLRITDLAIKKLTQLPNELTSIAYFDSTRA